MEEIETTEPTTTASSSGLVVFATLLVLAVGGALFWVRYDMEQNLRQMALEEQAVLRKLEQRLDALEGKATELSARPALDAGTIDTLKGTLSDTQKTITLLTERVEAIEKAPELLAPQPVASPVVAPAPAEPAPVPNNAALQNLKIAILSGSPYQAEMDIWYKAHPKAESYASLRNHAEKGVATEMALRQQLKTILSNATTGEQAAFPEKSMAARINQHFSQFISIRKKGTTAPELEVLKAKLDSLPLQQLVVEVNHLPQPLSPPLTEWLGHVKARADVLADLTLLESAV